MAEVRSEKLKAALVRTAAEFVERVSNRTALITITRATTDKTGDRATIFFSVLPDEQAAAALDFLKRNRGELRQYIGQHIRLRQLPFIDVALEK